MTDIQELFEEAARAPAPPARLTADVLYGKGQRRNRIVATVGIAAAVVVAGLAAATAVVVVRAPDRGPTTAAEPRYTGGGTIAWAAATDRAHLFVVVAPECGELGRYCRKGDLIASADGGRSWTVRRKDVDPGRGISVAPRALLVPVDGSFEVSSDGGQTWHKLVRVDTAVPAVPSDGWLQESCTPPASPGVETRCRFAAGDARTGRVVPLASQPDMQIWNSVQPVRDAFWVTGRDKATRRAAAAVSSDAGRTWRVHVFSDYPTSEPDFTESALVTSLDGRTGYVVVTNGGIDPKHPPAKGGAYVYRTTDAGATWHRVDPDGTAPWSYGGASSFVRPDGTHVIAKYGLPNERNITFVASADGGRYQPVTMSGLPRDLIEGSHPVQVFPGGYLAFDGHSVYVSTDGTTWTERKVG